MNPHDIRLQLLPQLMYAMCNFRVDLIEVGPVFKYRGILVLWMDKVVHVWPHKSFIEPQVRLEFFLSVEDSVALLLFEHSLSFLKLDSSQLVF